MCSSVAVDCGPPSTPDLLALRHRLVRLARRHGRRRDDDEDLAHDLIVAALRRGLALDDDHFTRSLGGAARRHAAFVARSSVRRHRRDARLVRTDHDDDDDDGAVDDDDDVVRTPLAKLSPALLTTLVLLRAGLDKAEICAVCGITDAALRKRLQGLRAAAPIEALPLPSLPASTARFARRTSSLALLQALSRARPKKASSSTAATSAATSFAIHDPDGHGLIFGSSLGPLTDPAPTATAMKNPVAPSRGPKGPAC